MSAGHRGEDIRMVRKPHHIGVKNVEKAISGNSLFGVPASDELAYIVARYDCDSM
jgi:hypothetical protein